MGLRGPAKTPLEIIQRQGNPGHRPLNKTAPAPARKRPQPSASVKADKLVWRHYKRLVKHAEMMDVLREVDGRALEKLAQLEADWDRTVEIIREAGFTTQNKKTGMVHVHPLLKRLDTLHVQLRNGYRDFGFTPAARASLHTESAKQVDDWSDF